VYLSYDGNQQHSRKRGEQYAPKCKNVTQNTKQNAKKMRILSARATKTKVEVLVTNFSFLYFCSFCVVLKRAPVAQFMTTGPKMSSLTILLFSVIYWLIKSFHVIFCYFLQEE